MHARVITFEVESRVALDDAQEAFERHVVPEMRRLPGYDGAYMLREDHTRGLIVMLWETEDTLQSGEATPGLAEQMTRLQSQLGRRAVSTTSPRSATQTTRSTESRHSRAVWNPGGRQATRWGGAWGMSC